MKHVSGFTDEDYLNAVVSVNDYVFNLVAPPRSQASECYIYGERLESYEVGLVQSINQSINHTINQSNIIFIYPKATKFRCCPVELTRVDVITTLEPVVVNGTTSTLAKVGILLR